MGSSQVAVGRWLISHWSVRFDLKASACTWDRRSKSRGPQGSTRQLATRPQTIESHLLSTMNPRIPRNFFKGDILSRTSPAAAFTAIAAAILQLKFNFKWNKFKKALFITSLISPRPMCIFPFSRRLQAASTVLFTHHPSP
ncbi:hypothetical protein GN956_G12991 [Arapaima gigas]